MGTQNGSQLGSSLTVEDGGPFVLREIYHGKYNVSLTTSAGIVYKPITLMTPWPILLLGLAVSFLTLACGLVSDIIRHRTRNTPNQQPHVATGSSAIYMMKDRISTSTVKEVVKRASQPTFLHFIDTCLRLFTLCIVTIRSWAALIACCAAIHNGSSHYHSSTALFILLLSFAPDLMDWESLGAPILFLDAFVAFVACQLMLWNATTKDDQYGKLYLRNGTDPASCVFRVDGCPKTFEQVGCGLWGVIEHNIKNHKKSFGGISKTPTHNIMGVNRALQADALPIFLITFGPIGTAASLCLFAIFCAVIYVRAFRVIRGHRTRNRRANPLDPADMSAPRVLCALLICLLAVIAMPLTAVEQTKHRATWVVDGAGPLSNYTGDGVGGYMDLTTGAWSDCFKVRTPIDKFGFLRLWWEDVKHRPADYLSLT